MAKLKGNSASVEGGFFVTGRNRRGKEVQKHTVVKANNPRKPAVKAAPRVGVSRA